MKDIKISVIIPIYNTEKYLEETLDSILNQTMIDDIEVLMMDDGSQDDSRKIIEEYASKYDNFYGFYNENVGQGCERNFGMEHAKGEYIHFMDSDDYIPQATVLGMSTYMKPCIRKSTNIYLPQTFMKTMSWFMTLAQPIKSLKEAF